MCSDNKAGSLDMKKRSSRLLFEEKLWKFSIWKKMYAEVGKNYDNLLISPINVKLDVEVKKNQTSREEFLMSPPNYGIIHKSLMGLHLALLKLRPCFLPFHIHSKPSDIYESLNLLVVCLNISYSYPFLCLEYVTLSAWNAFYYFFFSSHKAVSLFMQCFCIIYHKY